ncbi:unnamed protein product [Urochloa humidicola]
MSYGPGGASMGHASHISGGGDDEAKTARDAAVVAEPSRISRGACRKTEGEDDDDWSRARVWQRRDVGGWGGGGQRKSERAGRGRTSAAMYRGAGWSRRAAPVAGARVPSGEV